MTGSPAGVPSASTPATAGTTTRAAVIDAFGGPELLHVAEVPLAAPGSAQVQVRVGAVAVNPVDLSTRAGRNIADEDAHFPMVLGWDVAGTVAAVGSGVTGWRAGDRVAAMVFQPIDQHGVYAQQVNLDAELLARVPDALSLEQAATVPLAGLTAAQLLDEALVDGASTLLVDGPLGAVGRAVVVLATRAGVAVTGVARPAQTDALLALGATEAVPRDGFDAALRERHPGGVAAAIDLVGGRAARATFDAVRDGGRYATAVPPYIDPTGRFDTERGITLHVHTVHPDSARLTELLGLAADGVLPTVVERIYPLDAAADAHRHQAAGRLTGRIVIVP
jgi:NADPH2:quinone reductase